MGTWILAVNERTSFPCVGAMDSGDSVARRKGCHSFLCLVRHKAAPWPSLLGVKRHLLPRKIYRHEEHQKGLLLHSPESPGLRASLPVGTGGRECKP